MTQTILLLVAFLGLGLGAVVGYYTRQSLAKKRAGTIEEKLQKKVLQAKNEAETIIKGAKEKGELIVEEAERERMMRHKELLKVEQILLKRENNLEEKSTLIEQRERELKKKIQELLKVKENLRKLQNETEKKLEKVANLSEGEAKKELLSRVEQKYSWDILEKIKKLEKAGSEQFEKKAKEIIALAIQRYGSSCVSEITTTTLALPNEEIKGRIIGKEGRNIHTLEKLTGAEVIVDDTPGALVISAFDPIRRQVAKTALEKLIKDGRIQPARIEEMVLKSQEEIASQIKEAGENACYEVGVLDLDPRLQQLLGRLKFRLSYGQNVLLHSLEVSHIAGALSAEIGANVKLAKKAGLLHDIGKTVDHQVEGSHVEIGMKILEKFGQEKEVISAMKSHHEEYPYESTEAVLVQAADAISGARPGARRDTVEIYLRRLFDLEKIALGFEGVEKAYAIQAGRELRVFITPSKVDDLGAQKLARDIANRIQEELKYPGEIKVTVIRETRAIEYAK